MKNLSKRILGIALTVCVVLTAFVFSVPVSASVATVSYSEDFDNLVSSAMFVPNDSSKAAGWEIIPNWTGSVERGAVAVQSEASHGGAGISDGRLHIYRHKRNGNGGNYVGATLTFPAAMTGLNKIIDFDMTVRSTIEEATAGIEFNLVNGTTVLPVFGIEADNFVYFFKDGVVSYTEDNKTSFEIEDHTKNYHRFRVVVDATHCTVYFDSQKVGSVPAKGFGTVTGIRFSATNDWIIGSTDLKNEGLIDNITVIDKASTYAYNFAGVADSASYVPAVSSYSPGAANYWLDLGTTGWDYRPNNFRSANYSDKDYAGVGIKGEKLYMYNKQSGEPFQSTDNLQSWGYAGARSFLDNGESYSKFSVDFDASLNSNIFEWEGQKSSANQTIANTQYAGLVFFVEREDQQQRWPLFGINQDNYVYLFGANSTDFKQLFVAENKTNVSVADATEAHYKVNVELGSDKTIIYSLYINGELVGERTFVSGLGAEDKALYQPKSIFFALVNITSEKTRDIKTLNHEAYVDNIAIEIPAAAGQTSVKYNRGTKADDYFLFGYSDPHGFTAETAATVVSEELNAASTNVSVDVLDDYTIRVNHTAANKFIGGNYTVTVGSDEFDCRRNGLSDMSIATEGNKAALSYKNTGSEVAALLICAVYDDATGKLVDVKTKEGALTAGIGKGEVSGTLETEAVTVGSGQSIKTFLWNGSTLKPIK